MALKLKGQGIIRVRPLAGGLDAWMELDFPTEALGATIVVETEA